MEDVIKICNNSALSVCLLCAKILIISEICNYFMLTLLKDRVIKGSFMTKDRVINGRFMIKDRVIRLYTL